MVTRFMVMEESVFECGRVVFNSENNIARSQDLLHVQESFKES